MIHARMKHAGRARIFSAREHNASRMTALLRSLDLLITSRYHACVLSMAGFVPQVAVGHDTRLATIYRDLGLKDRWFIDPGSAIGTESPTAGLFAGLQDRVDLLLKDPVLQKDLLCRGYKAHRGRARRNRGLLADFVVQNLGKTWNCGSSAAEPEPAVSYKGGAAWAA
jgi:hypothetical protein